GGIHANPHSTMAAAAAAGGGAAAAALPQPGAARIPLPRAKPAEIARKTIDGVRNMPLWRTPIAPAIFFSIIGVCILALVISVASIRSKNAKVAVVDTAAEQRVAKERQLRLQGEQLLRQGKVMDAFAKYQQLAKLAPKSPYVLGVVTKLTELRRESETKQQQLVQAKQLFDQGIVLLNNKQYSDAIDAFSESFRLNPNDDATANYLKLAQQFQSQVQQQQALANTQARMNPATATSSPSSGSRGPQGRTTTQAATGPAQISTTFVSKVNDGYVMVKVGADTVAYDNLWQETGRFLLKRRIPKDVNATKEIAPKNADVDIYVVIPSMSIQEHHTIPRVNFAPGSLHHLVVSFDPASKTFGYQLN
ncbi:MAG TPA: tetratricopeptide repeat protein, partial [Thermoanaerobaculia bacterium]|nr:tetratricopeptide repeat protein [Thermoanaerobaculia bacterium]